jgi:hypothetical protein
MSIVTRHSPAPPAAVFAVLADGWRYADWVVGAKRIRAVDPTWPAPGSRFHHKVGVGPAEIKDCSQCEAVDPPRSITLKVNVWPAGTAHVRLDLAPAEDGGTEITMEELPLEGLLKTLDNPLQRALLSARNTESLRRLSRLAERQAPADTSSWG